MADARPISIGMMRTREQPTTTSVAAAHAAAVQGATFFFFNLEDVDLARATISGRFYQDGDWVRRETGFPDVIENDPYRPRLPEVWNALIARARFTTPRLGGKLDMDQRMRSAGLFPDLLIPTVLATGPDDLERQLDEHQSIVVKPVFGSHGDGVIHLSRTTEGIRGSVEGRTFRMDSRGLVLFYERAVAPKPHLIQRYIASRSRAGQPFDVRLMVRRNGRGEWQTVWTPTRIGSGRTIASNFAAGGSVADTQSFLRLRYGADGEAIYARLLDLCREFPPAFQSLYEDRVIDALGIDIGLDETGRAWLFEVNPYPGANFCEIVDAVPRIGYALYLARNPHLPDARGGL